MTLYLLTKSDFLAKNSTTDVVRYHHRDKMLNGLGVVVFLALPWLVGGGAPTCRSFLIYS